MALKFPLWGFQHLNIFAGGENMHGRFEYVSLQTMERAVDTIIGIVTKNKKQKDSDYTSKSFKYHENVPKLSVESARNTLCFSI